MARRKRIVIPGHPHHITQRGVRKQDVFFRNEDRVVYYKLFKKYSERYGLEVLSHCLMTNHVHHLVVPREKDSLRLTFQLTHKKYAEYINARHDWSGHLWQERFYSSPVDSEYLWIAIRYIEQNPVEAKMCDHPAEYSWSSARARCFGLKDPVLTEDKRWLSMLNSRKDWFEWLATPELRDKITELINCTSSDLPTGSDSFLDMLEHEYGVIARPPKLGRPKRGKS